MNLDNFINRVLEIWSSSAKKPKASVRQTIRDKHLGKDLLFLDQKTLIPMRLAMAGVRFRISLTRQEINRGWLFLYPAFQYLIHRDLTAKDFHFEDDKGQVIPGNPVAAKTKVKTIFSRQEHEQTALDLGWWYKMHQLQRNDNLLITILDWETNCFQLLPEKRCAHRQHEAKIQQQNQALAKQLFQVLGTAHDEYVWGQVAIPTAYLRIKDPKTYPSNHWLKILEKDSRMRCTGARIHYADWSSPIEDMLSGSSTSAARQPPLSVKHLSQEERAQVYRFKAFLRNSKNLWWRIEILGRQTLADFDSVLRVAFEHDRSDHLSGFWQLVRRGQSHRYREIDLGHINSFGEGEAAEIPVASLELEPGNTLKYVYDFGDWIEHRIKLESIVEPEKEATYPCIVGQNKPQYRDCQNCKEQDIKTKATWICITCSNQQQENIGNTILNRGA